MIDKTEAERIAEAVHCLRPDWVASSIVRLIGESPELRSRAYRDLAVAFAYVACDTTSLTPGRVREQGPWWSHTNAQRATQSTVTTRCPVPGHGEHPAWNCPQCAAEVVTDPEVVRAGADAVRAQFRAHRRGTPRPEPSQPEPPDLTHARQRADAEGAQP